MATWGDPRFDRTSFDWDRYGKAGRQYDTLREMDKYRNYRDTGYSFDRNTFMQRLNDPIERGGEMYWEDLDNWHGESKRGTSENTWLNYGVRGEDIPEWDKWFRPRADILDEGKHIRVEFELPGVPKETISLTIAPDYLILSTAKPLSAKQSKAFFYQNERHFGNFYRRLELPDFIDTKHVGAYLENGVLKIVMQKAQPGHLGEGRTLRRIGIQEYQYQQTGVPQMVSNLPK